MLAGDCPAGSGAPPSRARAAYAYGGSGRLVAVVADLLYRRRDPAGNRGACGAHMAHPLVRAGALDLLEEAVHTLRAAPLATIVAHWIGSVPFVLGLLVFWNDMAQPRTPDATCAFEACAPALLLLWMELSGAGVAGGGRGRPAGSGGGYGARLSSVGQSRWQWRWRPAWSCRCRGWRHFTVVRRCSRTARIRTRSEERRVGNECRCRWSPY